MTRTKICYNTNKLRKYIRRSKANDEFYFYVAFFIFMCFSCRLFTKKKRQINKNGQIKVKEWHWLIFCLYIKQFGKLKKERKPSTTTTNCLKVRKLKEVVLVWRNDRGRLSWAFWNNSKIRIPEKQMNYQEIEIGTKYIRLNESS